MARAKEVDFQGLEALGMALWDTGFHIPALPGTIPIQLDFRNHLLPGSQG